MSWARQRQSSSGCFFNLFFLVVFWIIISEYDAEIFGIDRFKVYTVHELAQLVVSEFRKTKKTDSIVKILKKSDRENLLYRIFEFVEKNYKNDCSLERLSDDTGFSYHYLSRYFKSRVSITFNSYVNLYRISKACYILNNTDYTVIQCALECGYTSLRSFNRNFRLRTKLTPIEYRSKS